MNNLGFSPYSNSKGVLVNDTFIYEAKTVIFADVRRDNVIKNSEGFLFPIDIHIQQLAQF